MKALIKASPPLVEAHGHSSLQQGFAKLSKNPPPSRHSKGLFIGFRRGQGGLEDHQGVRTPLGVSAMAETTLGCLGFAKTPLGCFELAETPFRCFVGSPVYSSSGFGFE